MVKQIWVFVREIVTKMLIALQASTVSGGSNSNQCLGVKARGHVAKSTAFLEVTISPTKQVTSAPTMKEVTLSPIKQLTSAPIIHQPLVTVSNQRKNACEGDCDNDKECKV